MVDAVFMADWLSETPTLQPRRFMISERRQLPAARAKSFVVSPS
jgi:hypothetical protein